MNVTAVLAIRNEEAYLANCLRDLISNGLDFVVIDNDSTELQRPDLRAQRICGASGSGL